MQCRKFWKRFEATSRSSRLESHIQRNFPHCIGAIDGKRVAIESPKLSRTQYFNYKGFYIVVLLVNCDAKYCFTYVDFRQYGSINDRASWEVLVYIKHSRKTNSICQLQRKRKGLKIHCPTFFSGTRYSRLLSGLYFFKLSFLQWKLLQYIHNNSFLFKV